MTPRVGNILFSGSMVRALLDGRKTQTRRLIKPQTPEGFHVGPCHWIKSGISLWHDGGGCTCRDFKGGQWLSMHGRFMWAEDGYRELLYVREAFAGINGPQRAAYKADGDNPDEWKWTPSIHMPRWASRLTLEVTGTKLERLQDISEEDARAEGVPTHVVEHTFRKCYRDDAERAAKRIEYFSALWAKLHGPDSWERNDEVVALSFKVHRCNVDEVRL